MLAFDISEQEFVELAKEAKEPSFIQLMAKVELKEEIEPHELYGSFNDSYSYLLESVEKEERKARFSFVGTNPDAIFTIKDRKLTIKILNNSDYLDFVYSKYNKGIVDTLWLNANTYKFESEYNWNVVGNILTIDIKKEMNVLDAIRLIFLNVPVLNQKRFNKHTFNGGLVGYIGYDVIYDCWIDVTKTYTSDTPDIQFMVATKTIVFDHFEKNIYIIITPFIKKHNSSSDALNECVKLEDIYKNALNDAEKMQKNILCINKHKQKKFSITGVENCPTDMNQKSYENAVQIAKKHIIDGDIFQVVLSRKYEIKTKESPFELYLKLKEVNPSPYMYLFKFNDLSIVGASPETLMSIYKNKVIINPIAGTCPRGKNEKEDKIYAEGLLKDEKERAEHIMLVDLGRNDVRMVSKSGTVKVDEFMKVVQYSHVQHIESTVTGILRDECDIFDATKAIMPAGTLSGAPKIRAMEIINNLEKSARGIYGGGVGYYSWNNDSEFAIVIRTMIIKDNIITIRAGAGIVADSNPTKEYEETERKMAAVIEAIGRNPYEHTFYK